MTQLESFGLTEHVLVMSTGKMTQSQRKRVKEKTTVRTDKLIEAVEWLCKNHRTWKTVDLVAVRKKLEGVEPTLINTSEEVECENANVEEQEVCTCYYPDGAATEASGGFEERGAFKKFVEKMKAQNFNMEFKANLEKKFVKERDSDQLIGGCLLQFPYGVCGMGEKRRKYDGSFTTYIMVDEYLSHISKLSQPCFQTPMFQLISISMTSRVRLLKQSRLQLRGEVDAQQIAAGFNTSDLSTTIVQRRKLNRSGGTYVSRRVLDSVDACSRALPHTNEVARKARGIGESMQHVFGTGSIFLTVSFDDDCCYLTQVLSGVEVDDDVNISTLTEEELKERCKERTGMRLEFPGVTALNFEMLLQILVEEVVGWDMRKDKRMQKPGYFGICEAFSLSIEEQGRKSLHGHMTAWIEGYKELQRMLFFETGMKRTLVERTLHTYFDHVGTTELFGKIRQSLHTSFQHDCEIVNSNNRSALRVVSDQELRGLRHVCGYKECDGTFAVCETCGKKFTYEELVTKHVTTSCMILRRKEMVQTMT